MASDPTPEARKEFGARLRMRRVDAGLPGYEALKRLRLTIDELKIIEAGISVPYIKRILEMCLVYGVNQTERTYLLNQGAILRGNLSDSATRQAEESTLDPAIARGLASLIPTTPTVDGAGIFISYRRSDQPALAGRLYDKLSAKFGVSQVFMDVDSIDLGLDFVEVLDRTLARCKALIVVIGQDWLNAIDEDGNRRLYHHDDLVRMEIETALNRNIRVIPILVDGTRMPRAGELPHSIMALARRNGRDIWNARFNSDCLELISALERLIRTHGEVRPNILTEPYEIGKIDDAEVRAHSVYRSISILWPRVFGGDLESFQNPKPDPYHTLIVGPRPRILVQIVDLPSGRAWLSKAEVQEFIRLATTMDMPGMLVSDKHISRHAKAAILEQQGYRGVAPIVAVTWIASEDDPALERALEYIRSRFKATETT